MHKSSNKIDDLERAFMDDAQQLQTKQQNEIAGVVADPTPEQRSMQQRYDPQTNPLYVEQSMHKFVDGYRRLADQMKTNQQAMQEAVRPMQVSVMSNSKLGQRMTATTNDSLMHMVQPIGYSHQSMKTEKKARKTRRIDAQLNWM